MAVKEKEVVDLDHRQGGSLSFSDKELATIRRTVAKGATEDEFRMFMHLARTYGLDPFNKEIFFWKIDGKPTIMTSRDGYLKIANNHPAYQGLVSDVLRANDGFVKEMKAVEHSYGDPRGEIVGAYAMAYREDRKYPAYAYAPFDEYNAHTRVWNQYPSAMILKCAESMALKRAFSVSGLVSREELEVSHTGNIPKDEEANNVESDQQLSRREQQIKEIIDDDPELKGELYDYLGYIKEENNLDQVSLEDLTKDQYRELKMILDNFGNKTTRSA